MNPSCPDAESTFSSHTTIDEEIARQSELAANLNSQRHYETSLAALYRALSLSKNSYGSTDDRTIRLHEQIAAIWFRKGNYNQAENNLRISLNIRKQQYPSVEIFHIRKYFMVS